MRIAVSATGKDLDSQVDARFGRCFNFLIVEIENGEIKDFKAIENTAATLGGGAGITAAQLVANEKVDAVITVNIGPRAFAVLQQLGIDIYQGVGKVRDVIKQFVEGKLPKLEAPSGPGGFGMGWRGRR